MQHALATLNYATVVHYVAVWWKNIKTGITLRRESVENLVACRDWEIWFVSFEAKEWFLFCNKRADSFLKKSCDSSLFHYFCKWSHHIWTVCSGKNEHWKNIQFFTKMLLVLWILFFESLLFGSRNQI